MAAENLECFIDGIAEIGPAVVAMEFDPFQLGFLQPGGRGGQRFRAESPVAPGEAQARLKLFRLIFLELTEGGANTFVGDFEVLEFHSFRF